jgi:alpha-glucosidase (family GH31 glycosyl hydrolase)
MARFQIGTSAARESAVITYDNVRITVLAPCLIRIETGNFTDLPTQKVWFRDLGHTGYKVYKSGDIRMVKTEEICLHVNIRTGFVKAIELADGNIVRDFRSGNLLGTARTLDGVNGATKLSPGILSLSGVSVLDDSDSMLIETDGTICPREKCTDRYYFAYGHDYKRCLRDFFRLTGNVPLIPKYVLGNWWSRYKAYTQQEYRQLMEQFLDRNIPITVATIDMDWHWTDVVNRFGEDAKPASALNKEELWFNHTAPGWTGYSWNTELFPNHKALLDWLHDQNFHVTLNVHPAQGFRFFENCYEDACTIMGLDPTQKKQIPFNLSQDKFMEAYLDAGHHPLEDEGVDFWWIDWQQGTNSGVPGLDPLWALNHFHTLDASRNGKRPLILSRYAGLGSHRYPLGFSGDTFTTWQSLQFQPYFTNTAANAGYTWWSHDIGGHQFGIQDDELYVRWIQYGVFSPINRLHSSCSDFLGKEPWKRSFAAKEAAERALRLRQKQIPYLYSANYQTHTQGIPICMPLYYEYDREEAYGARNQYFFGPSLLVCPITEKSNPRLNLAKVDAWLPEGRWTDIFTGQIYRGGGYVALHRDLDSIPVLAKSGAIVPMYRSGESNDLSLSQSMDIHVWRGNGCYELYEDDGETMAYRDGKFVITAMVVEETADTIRFVIRKPQGDLSLISDNRNWNICFRDVKNAEISVNGTVAKSISRDHVVIPVNGAQSTVIELKNCQYAVNAPVADRIADLLTRVQGSNIWKAANFPTAQNPERAKKLPKDIRLALEEFGSLLD